MKRTIKNRKGDQKIELSMQEWMDLQMILKNPSLKNLNEKEKFLIDAICDYPAENYYEYKQHVK
jgi:hypothetical protein